MNQWAFVFAAYGAVALTTAGLIAWAWKTMRTAEAETEAVKRRR